MGLVEDVAAIRQLITVNIATPTGCKSVKRVKVVEVLEKILDLFVQSIAPDDLTFYWADFVDSGEDGRIRYDNLLWAGWNPILSVGNMPYLEVDVDYELLDTGGFILLSSGNVPFVYAGQIIRAVGFELPIVPEPPYPPAGSYRLINNSSVDASYFITSSIPLVVGQIVNSEFTLGESVLGQIQSGQKLTFTRYLSDGTVDETLELTNPPSNQINTGIMDLTKSYKFIYTDNV